MYMLIHCQLINSQINNCMSKPIVYVVCCLMLLSCSGKPSADGIQTVRVTPELLSDRLEIHPPLQMIDMDSHLMFITPGMEHSVLFWNKKNQQTSIWGQMGNGPDDFTSAQCVRVHNREVEYFDSNLKKCVKYRLHPGDSVSLTRISECRLENDSLVLLNLHRTSTGCTVGFIGYGSNHLFALLDESLHVVRTFGDIPVPGRPDRNNLQLYGWFASYGDRIFFASQPLGYLVCYQIRRDGTVQKEWEHFKTEPRYDVTQQKWEKTNRFGYYDLCANGQYLFVSYSGKELSEQDLAPSNILVFTHDGKLICDVAYQGEYVPKLAVNDSLMYTYGKDRLTVSRWKEWKLQNK